MQPRLCWTPGRLRRLRHPESALQRRLLRTMIRQTRTDLRETGLRCGGNGGVQKHNFHLIAAEEIQRRLLRAMAAWLATGDQAFRREVGRLLALITDADHWSWIAWRRGEKAWDALFDLSYGVHSATLAFVLDWMGAELTEGERLAVLRNAERRSFGAFLKPFHDPAARHGWWMKPKGTNWEGVCVGGVGLLALALHDKVEPAREVLEKVEQGLRHYLGCMHTDGGWIEGPGYWNFGHSHAFLQLLSTETVFGEKNPLLRLPAARNTLWFPILFSPNGVATGFGDSIHFAPKPFHLLAAQRFRERELAAELEQRLCKAALSAAANSCKAPLLETLLACGGKPAPARRSRALLAKRYRMGWALLADHPTEPAIHVSIRGGSFPVPHGHQDLSSFEVVAGGRRVLGNVRQNRYMDTSFGHRRFELYEPSFHSKNILLINGVGFLAPATVHPVPVCGRGLKGFVLNMSSAMGTIKNQLVKGGEQPMVRIYRRGFFLTGEGDLLVLDRVVANAGARLEARLHTTETVRRTADGWNIGRRNAVAVRVVSSDELVFQTATGCTNQPDAPPDHILRTLVRELTLDALVATLVSANPARELRMTGMADHWKLVVSTGGRRGVNHCFQKNTLRPRT